MSSQDPQNPASGSDGRNAPGGQQHEAPSFGQGGDRQQSGQPSWGPNQSQPGSQPSGDPGAQQGYGQPGYSYPGAGQQRQHPGYGGQGAYDQPQGGGQQYTAQGNYGQATFQQGGQPLSPSDARTWALISHIAAPVLFLFSAGWIGFAAPLIIWFIFKDRDPLVRNASAGAFNFNVIVFALNVVIWILAIPTLGLALFLLPVLGILSVVFAVLGAMQANKGLAYKYPMQIPILS